MAVTDLDQLDGRIAQCFGADRARLVLSLRHVRRLAQAGKPFDRSLAKLEQALEESAARRQWRRAHVPRPTFPDELPITAHVSEITAALAAHQSIVVCGDTGSGKSTQLPKIALAAGRGIDGLIGHTQPRRIAARSLARRIAQELDSPLGQAVGFQVRFEDRASPDSFIKLMTDGILLAQTQTDRALRQYDTLILDEAHERSLNIDFLLGYLKQLLPRRPDLKLIVTSATIDPGRFSRFFDDAPIIEVSGRSFGVDVQYRPIDGAADDAQDEPTAAAVVQAVRDIVSGAEAGPAPASRGDVLVFLAGEREIRDVAQLLHLALGQRVEVLPLYARLSVEAQERVFQPHRRQRVVLATNVAETSLTVPGIVYVVDTGLARISRYSPRSKVQRLPVEPISQASAHQRAGRCGRVAPGLCLRLYSQEDFERRPRFTAAEILRTSLAGVILRMKALDLGEPDRFAFIDAPSTGMIRDGYQTLYELGALDPANRLTRIGTQLARLPIDPRLARMILAGREEGCLREVLIIAAALAVQDPRERPLDQQDAADRAHAVFRHEDSDFLSLVRLWETYDQQSRSLSSNRLRRWCGEHFVSPMRMREWHDVHRELVELLPAVGIPPSDIHRRAADYDPVHRALLTGLLANVGLLGEGGEYEGPRGARFRVFPGSTLFKKNVRWVMAAEIVQTTRLYARTVARIRPSWIERLARHLVGRDYFKPFWDDRVARVLGFEKVMLHGLVVQSGRQVDFGPIAPRAARDIFISEGLVQGRYQTHAPFLAHNLGLEADVRRLETRLRRTLLVSEEKRFEFYNRRIPPTVYTGRHFEGWRRKAAQRDAKLLFMTRADVLLDTGLDMPPEAFPDALDAGGLHLPLEYRHEVGHVADGVTIVIPLAALGQLRSERLDYLVPGLLPEKIEALLRSLPKTLRTALAPLGELARRCARQVHACDQPLATVLARTAHELTGVGVPDDAFNRDALPEHLRFHLRVIDASGGEIASGRDLAALQRQLAAQATASLMALAGRTFQRDGISRWDFGDLPEHVELACGPATLLAYPAVVDRQQSVSLRLAPTSRRAAELSRAGVRRLFLIELAGELDQLVREIEHVDELLLHYVPLGPGSELRADLCAAAVERVFLVEQPGGPDAVRSHMEFELRLRAGLPRLAGTLREVAQLAGRILAQHQKLALALARATVPAWGPAVFDLKDQLAYLLPCGFLVHTPATWLPHLPRYLAAMNARLTKLATGGLLRDGHLLDQVRPIWETYLAQARAADSEPSPDLNELRWLIEEWRVSLFAQELGTAVPVSRQRIERLLERIA